MSDARPPVRGQSEAGTFKLSPQESFVHGVHLAEDTLAFKASGTQLIFAGLWLALGLPVGAMLVVASLAGAPTMNGVHVQNRAAGVVAGVVAAAMAVATAVGLLRRGVVADREGLQLRWVLRQRRLRWVEVTDVVAVETAPQRWTVGASAGRVSARMEPVGSWCVGVVVLLDGTALQLPSFTAAARDEGLSMGGPTATERKVAALRRYREHVVGGWPDGPVAVDRIVDPTRFEARATAVSWPIVVWLLATWATGSWVPLFWLVLGWVASGMTLLRRRRRSALSSVRI